MQIEAIIIFPNIKNIFHTKSRYPREKIGWATTVWTLTEDNGLYWRMRRIYGLIPKQNRIHTLSTEKKKRFASKLAREFNCKIIYLDKRRASDSIGTFDGSFKDIPFMEKDLCR